MCSSIPEGTWNQYNACFRKYWIYCPGHHHDVFKYVKYDLNT
nr:unnamed protein product [Callosobruchus analis]